MSTKERILEKALELYNEQGVSSVSSRNVSDALDISYGNLCYHFPKKKDLINRLYLNMQTELNQEFKRVQDDIFSLGFIVGSLRALLEVLFKYKFFFLDNTYIVRQLPKINAHYTNQLAERKKIWRMVTNYLLQNGYVKPEPVDWHYDMVIHTLMMIVNSCVSDAELYNDLEKEKRIDFYLDQFYSVIRMSLTEKGLLAFDKLYRERKEKEKEKENLG